MTDKQLQAIQRVFQILAGIVGLVFICSTLGWIGSSDGFGPIKLVILILCFVCLSLGTWIRNRKLLQVSFLCVISFSLVYGLLVPLDYMIYRWKLGERRDIRESGYGLIQEDPFLGFRMKENWKGYFTQGSKRLPIETNSLGHRDSEPDFLKSKDISPIFLGGDSFTYGALLGQDETIGAQINRLAAQDSGAGTSGTNEARGSENGIARGSTHESGVSGSQRKRVAYNTGVSGYGPQHVLKTFKQNRFIAGGDWVYLFYANDITDVLQPWDFYRVFENHFLNRRKDTGEEYTPDELRELIKNSYRWKGESFKKTLSDTVSLMHLRNRMGVNKILEMMKRKPRVQQDSGDVEGVKKAVEMVLQMRDLARERQARFWVVIVPTIWEADEHFYHPANMAFVRNLKAKGVSVIELLDTIGYSDYLNYDGHFGAEGAQKTAQKIWTAVSAP